MTSRVFVDRFNRPFRLPTNALIPQDPGVLNSSRSFNCLYIYISVLKRNNIIILKRMASTVLVYTRYI